MKKWIAEINMVNRDKNNQLFLLLHRSFFVKTVDVVKI